MADWYSSRCALTWKLKGTKFNRLLFQLVPKTLRTEETDAGLLPTPAVMQMDYEPKDGWIWMGKYWKDEKGKKRQTDLTTTVKMQMLPTPIAGNWKGQRRSDGTASMLSGKASLGLLPTPTAMDSTNATATMKSTQVKEGSMHSVTLARAMTMGILPTPRVGGQEDYKTRNIRQGHQKAMSYLEANIQYQTGTTSHLNPRFVAEMMGFPANWTELPFQSGEQNQSKDTVTQ